MGKKELEKLREELEKKLKENKKIIYLDEYRIRKYRRKQQRDPLDV